MLEKTGQKRTKKFSPAWRAWARSAIFNAQVRSGKSFKITVEGLVKLCPSHCPCCSRLMAPKNPINNSPTVDRINNSKGYVKSNIWIICFQCNSIKRNLKTPQYLYKVADAWWEKLEEIKNASNNSSNR